MAKEGAQVTTAIVTTIREVEVQPLLFNKHWTTEEVTLKRERHCDNIVDWETHSIPAGSKALVLLKDGKRKYFYCGVNCQRQAAVTAKVRKTQEFAEKKKVLREQAEELL